MDTNKAPTGRHVSQTETPEQLLDVFKAAALSVTKLYKTSALVESRARVDGYQECLDDLLSFLNKANIGLTDGEGWSIRRWATERLDGRDSAPQTTESEDENERVERTSSPEITRTNPDPQPPVTKRRDSPTPNTCSVPEPVPEEPMAIVVPSQDNFSFQSSHPYPNIATLDLEDSRTRDRDGSSHPPSRGTRSRIGGHNSKSGPRGAGHLGKGAGTKRRWDFDDFFGGCLGGKDPFGNGGKRSRHA
ncbi:hypothetical protein X797_008042 [Metarhizium robertsii]|uniref:Uncharacterized protein n=2 Tax=Metarhizium robertsii TaxID=568076 RepID=E9EJ27_METRA|nr:uncharacterized protein MAA_00026 [Metarhizium robertsii ARSEF 23]EFZ02952.1 hypothetical protein MAA_00026 [Metarhizium robertsii ARSEF 23]EXU98805.1 hypothetical protein X797_008042 [Metarhizium robertsii]